MYAYKNVLITAIILFIIGSNQPIAYDLMPVSALASDIKCPVKVGDYLVFNYTLGGSDTLFKYEISDISTIEGEQTIYAQKYKETAPNTWQLENPNILIGNLSDSHIHVDNETLLQPQYFNFFWDPGATAINASQSYIDAILDEYPAGYFANFSNDANALMGEGILIDLYNSSIEKVAEYRIRFSFGLLSEYKIDWLNGSQDELMVLCMKLSQMQVRFTKEFGTPVDNLTLSVGQNVTYNFSIIENGEIKDNYYFCITLVDYIDYNDYVGQISDILMYSDTNPQMFSSQGEAALPYGGGLCQLFMIWYKDMTLFGTIAQIPNSYLLNATSEQNAWDAYAYWALSSPSISLMTVSLNATHISLYEQNGTFSNKRSTAEYHNGILTSHLVEHHINSDEFIQKTEIIYENSSVGYDDLYKSDQVDNEKDKTSEGDQAGDEDDGSSSDRKIASYSPFLMLISALLGIMSILKKNRKNGRSP